MSLKLAFTAADGTLAQDGRAALALRYGDTPLDQADVIVALGGDGALIVRDDSGARHTLRGGEVQVLPETLA